MDLAVALLGDDLKQQVENEKVWVEDLFGK
jgi:hypothetical protein